MRRVLALVALGVLLATAALALGGLAAGSERVEARPLPVAEGAAVATGDPAALLPPTSGDGPVVRYGDSGLLDEDQGMPVWQQVLLSLAAAGGLGGAYLSYRRLR